MIDIWFDGACQPVNPGGAMSWSYIIKKDSEPLATNYNVLKKDGFTQSTNNVAEYYALFMALNKLIELGLTSELVVFRGDSQLVIQQMNGNWRIKQGAYVKVAKDCLNLKTHFNHIYGEWIPREQNQDCDDLCNLAYEGEHAR